MTTALRIDCDEQRPALTVSDLPAAIDFYRERLGFELAFTWGDPPTFAGVTLDRARIFLRQGIPGPAGCTVFFTVGDADEACAFHRANGVEIVDGPEDREWGLRDYTIRDRDGYHLVFGNPIYNLGPPVEIERVEVPVRLEKRLAALLEDLAAHKRMSLTSCLEEILLHTCERLGDGVASPHTVRTLEHIQELRRKHGIDYDSHASYRFVEVPPGKGR